ncbi:MAG: AbrB/MazE/SpoVT family DNA-binding domain-containing protein [bacterium]|nr:AbrB/MazE/SpoVT family DNA-binding domain-containing protein [bacterium]
MKTAIVTTKGQIVIPSRIRKHYKIKRGTHVCFLERDNDIIIRPVTDDYIESLKGSTGTSGRALKVLLEEKKKEREL